MIFAAAVCALYAALPLPAAVTTAKAAADQASKEPSVTDSIAYLTKTIPTLTAAAERRAAYAFLGSVQEQIGLYGDAVKSYAAAAAIAAGDAAGMPKKSNEQLALDAVRCALSSGDCDTADRYLNSSIRDSMNETILAYVKLYEQWSALCRAENSAAIAKPVAALRSYDGQPAMKAVQASILLTLWHLTGEQRYADSLKKTFPSSPEAAIVRGAAQLLPAPFWYFTPRSGTAVPDVAQATAVAHQPTEATTPTAPASAEEQATAANDKIVKQQLGLFREEANARRMVAQAQEKGFKAYITTETRPSGTTYYLVVVDENKAGTMGTELRDAGFDCYPVY